MNKKGFWWAVRIMMLLVLAAGVGVLAQDGPLPEHFSGVINDYTAQTGTSPTAVGPWEMRGPWSLHVNQETGTADFSAAITMEEGDYWLWANGESPTQDPSVRGQHTHRIRMTGQISYDTSTCPIDNPTDTARFMVKGNADITANGNAAPFQTKGGVTTLSPLQVCISGGTDVPFSNLTLAFSAPASGHFGSQAIHGVVRHVRGDRDSGH
jgi:hypothetical protein